MENRQARRGSIGELARRAASGDGAATEDLVGCVLPRVRNLVRYLVRGDLEAEDVGQDALLTVLERLSSYRGDGRFEAWVDGVVMRVAIAAMRKRRRRHRFHSSVPVEEAVPSEPAPVSGDYLARRRTVRALDQLPVEQRHALVLHHVLGMSIPEVARELNVPAETVRSRLRLGMGKLRASVLERSELEREGTR